MSERTEHPPSSPTLEERAQRIIDTVETVAMFLPVVGGRQTDMMTDTAALLRDFLAARRQVEAQHQETVKKLTRQRDLARFDAAAQLDGYMEVRAELATLRAQLTEAQEWADIVTRGQSPCGHWKAYCYTEDGIGRKVDCWQCRTERAEAEITRLKGATS